MVGEGGEKQLKVLSLECREELYISSSRIIKCSLHIVNNIVFDRNRKLIDSPNWRSYLFPDGSNLWTMVGTLHSDLWTGFKRWPGAGKPAPGLGVGWGKT